VALLISQAANRKPLPSIVQVVAEAHGLDFSPFDESFLAKIIDRRRQAKGGESAADYARRVATDRAEAAAVQRSLHISHSEFFREPVAFALLEQQFFPSLLGNASAAGRHEIRVWSAGCAGGQEPWSVAMLLDDLIAADQKEISYRIFATTAAEEELAVARAGVYSESQLGNVRWKHLQQCFSPQQGSYAIVQRLKDHVDFSVHDLLDGHHHGPSASIYGDFDLVLCCNVLIYYRPEIQLRILKNLLFCLAPHGCLVVGEAERHLVEQTGDFRELSALGNVFQPLHR
jgi:chemotaxis methyl-accepting protein methylase